MISMTQNHLQNISLNALKKIFPYLVLQPCFPHSALRHPTCAPTPRLAPWHNHPHPTNFLQHNHKSQTPENHLIPSPPPALSHSNLILPPSPIERSLARTIQSSYEFKRDNTLANMDSGKVPVKLVKVTRVLGRTGTTLSTSSTLHTFPRAICARIFTC